MSKIQVCPDYYMSDRHRVEACEACADLAFAARVKAFQIRLQTDRSQVPTDEIVDLLADLLMKWQIRTNCDG